jgi:general secretion pathway protein G
MTSLSIRSSRLSRRASKGFTLVEILIVVIILGILAAIVIPQFTNASTSAKISNMASQCQTVKSQISLYSLQHNDVYPGQTTLFSLLTTQTDVNGNITSVAPAGGSLYGPYLQATPVNPLTNSSTVAVDPGLGKASPAGTADGWDYNASTGAFHGVNLAGNASDDGQ